MATAAAPPNPSPLYISTDMFTQAPPPSTSGMQNTIGAGAGMPPTTSISVSTAAGTCGLTTPPPSPANVMPMHPNGTGGTYMARGTMTANVVGLPMPAVFHGHIYFPCSALPAAAASNQSTVTQCAVHSTNTTYNMPTAPANTTLGLPQPLLCVSPQAATPTIFPENLVLTSNNVGNFAQTTNNTGNVTVQMPMVGYPIGTTTAHVNSTPVKHQFVVNNNNQQQQQQNVDAQNNNKRHRRRTPKQPGRDQKQRSNNASSRTLTRKRTRTSAPVADQDAPPVLTDCRLQQNNNNNDALLTDAAGPPPLLKSEIILPNLSIDVSESKIPRIRLSRVFDANNNESAATNERTPTPSPSANQRATRQQTGSSQSPSSAAIQKRSPKSPANNNKKSAATKKAIGNKRQRNRKTPIVLTKSYWKAVGEPTMQYIYYNNDAKPVKHECYNEIRHTQTGETVRVRDCVLINASGEPDSSEPPYVAKVANFYRDHENGSLCASVMWYYRPDQTEVHNLHPPFPYPSSELLRCAFDRNLSRYQPSTKGNELFASRHLDSIYVDSIQDFAYVVTYAEYCRYRAENQYDLAYPNPSDRVCERGSDDYKRRDRQPCDDCNEDQVFFVRRVYDFAAKKLLGNPSYNR